MVRNFTTLLAKIQLAEYSSPAVDAVAGQPLVRNLTTLLAKIQLAEYSSIVSLTKRAQSVQGRLNTVSGVCVMVRKSALLASGW
ncbi:cellulose synthase/poly-beta-1,6-N-acetylglucosamine synthase-like glycosyltransferase [Weissella uvarum]|uniref:hypothetical protein n=1 Tax=Weissella uvarum TaxID=1479233 RepID=UPI00195FD9E5|nr:hypothetical protein [Weissella uvarum]MBM7617335.1 cellulose synthase/poly-beta-1,6-N-acetylglucosamine synthase-like glycosyltransferase [Weissella uvarum]